MVMKTRRRKKRFIYNRLRDWLLRIGPLGIF